MAEETLLPGDDEEEDGKLAIAPVVQKQEPPVVKPFNRMSVMYAENKPVEINARQVQMQESIRQKQAARGRSVVGYDQATGLGGRWRTSGDRYQRPLTPGYPNNREVGSAFTAYNDYVSGRSIEPLTPTQLDIIEGTQSSLGSHNQLKETLVGQRNVIMSELAQKKNDYTSFEEIERDALDFSKRGERGGILQGTAKQMAARFAAVHGLEGTLKANELASAEMTREKELMKGVEEHLPEEDRKSLATVYEKRTDKKGKIIPPTQIERAMTSSLMEKGLLLKRGRELIVSRDPELRKEIERLKMSGKDIPADLVQSYMAGNDNEKAGILDGILTYFRNTESGIKTDLATAKQKLNEAFPPTASDKVEAVSVRQVAPRDIRTAIATAGKTESDPVKVVNSVVQKLHPRATPEEKAVFTQVIKNEFLSMADEVTQKNGSLIDQQRRETAARVDSFVGKMNSEIRANAMNPSGFFEETARSVLGDKIDIRKQMADSGQQLDAKTINQMVVDVMMSEAANLDGLELEAYAKQIDAYANGKLADVSRPIRTHAQEIRALLNAGQEKIFAPISQDMTARATVQAAQKKDQEAKREELVKRLDVNPGSAKQIPGFFDKSTVVIAEFPETTRTVNGKTSQTFKDDGIPSANSNTASQIVYMHSRLKDNGDWSKYVKDLQKTTGGGSFAGANPDAFRAIQEKWEAYSDVKDSEREGETASSNRARTAALNIMQSDFTSPFMAKILSPEYRGKEDGQSFWSMVTSQDPLETPEAADQSMDTAARTVSSMFAGVEAKDRDSKIVEISKDARTERKKIGEGIEYGGATIKAGSMAMDLVRYATIATGVYGDAIRDMVFSGDEKWTRAGLRLAASVRYFDEINTVVGQYDQAVSSLKKLALQTFDSQYTGEITAATSLADIASLTTRPGAVKNADEFFRGLGQITKSYVDPLSDVKRGGKYDSFKAAARQKVRESVKEFDKAMFSGNADEKNISQNVEEIQGWVNSNSGEASKIFESTMEDVKREYAEEAKKMFPHLPDSGAPSNMKPFLTELRLDPVQYSVRESGRALRNFFTTWKPNWLDVNIKGISDLMSSSKDPAVHAMVEKLEKKYIEIYNKRRNKAVSSVLNRMESGSGGVDRLAYAASHPSGE